MGLEWVQYDARRTKITFFLYLMRLSHLLQDFVCKMLSNEAAWQQKAEEALKNAADDSDSGKYKCCQRDSECSGNHLLPIRTVLSANQKSLNISMRKPRTLINELTSYGYVVQLNNPSVSSHQLRFTERFHMTSRQPYWCRETMKFLSLGDAFFYYANTSYCL